MIDCLVLGPTYIHFNQFAFAYKLANDFQKTPEGVAWITK